MPKYVIRREVPGVGGLDPGRLHELAASSNAVLAAMDGYTQWVHSYVTGDALYCIYNAESVDKIREHARLGGFPCDEIIEVSGIIDPVTGEG